MADDRPVLDQINLVASDVEATAAFYRLLGVDVPPATSDEWAAHHRSGVLQSDGLEVDLDSAAFASYWGAEGLPPGLVLDFRVQQRETVDAIYDRVTAGGHRGIRAPYDAFWGSRLAIVEGPDGVIVGVMSVRSDEHRGTTPDVSGFSA
ncbi:MAG: VOC family protein [Dehalococcoidia bacterium]